ncbi:MAG: hypothetical protein J3K34DRAFT_421311 [Monoraphidium minutum]|nr:MAG: hypothetical protein J3K34DRAFT_421311 [Monoraphidium minutum]
MAAFTGPELAALLALQGLLPRPAPAAHAPGAAAPAPAGAARSCLQCGAATAPGGGPLKVCRGCRAVRFCSEECLRLAWRAGHKEACAALRAARQ